MLTCCGLGWEESCSESADELPPALLRTSDSEEECDIVAPSASEGCKITKGWLMLANDTY